MVYLHRARTGGNERTNLLIGENSNNFTVEKLMVGVQGVWTQHTGTYTIPYGQIIYILLWNLLRLEERKSNRQSGFEFHRILVIVTAMEYLISSI